MVAHNTLLEGKKGLILGLANNRSLAWGITQSCLNAGAKLAFTYQNDILHKRIEPLLKPYNVDILQQCDVNNEADLEALFGKIEEEWGELDFVVHSVAFSDKNELTGRYIDTSADNFVNTMLVSCYSFTAIARKAERLMPRGGALLTLTYEGANRVMPHYNVMGIAKAALEASVIYLAEDMGKNNIRVNAISAGPIKTLAASGIGDFRYILRWNEYNSPLRRLVTIEDVGNTALYLLSDMSRSVTGDIIHVDAGYHVVGMKAIDAPDLTLPPKVDE